MWDPRKDETDKNCSVAETEAFINAPYTCIVRSVTKRLKAFILHAGGWGVNKRFCIGYSENRLHHKTISSGMKNMHVVPKSSSTYSYCICGHVVQSRF